MTLLREAATRARSDREANPKRHEERTELAQSLAKMLNGDWTVSRIQHYCHGNCPCRQNRAAAVDCLTSLLHQAWFAPLGVKVPSKTRWNTLGPSLALQAGGFACHQILNRTLARVLKPTRVDENKANESSYHHVCNMRRHQSLDFVTTQPASSQCLLRALVGTEPLDKLSARLQFLDHAGMSMVEVVSAQGVLFDVQARIAELVDHSGDGPLGAGFGAAQRHLRSLDPLGFDRQACLDSFRSTA